jgi:hypothetical protein
MNQQTVTYQDKIDELIFDIMHPKSEGIVFILVEGESDIRLFRKFFDLNNCKVENIPGGNYKVEDGVSELLNRSELVFGIRDADFLHLDPSIYSKTNIFLTDYHDTEISLIENEEVFSALLSEYTNIVAEEHKTVKSIIYSILIDISNLKYANLVRRIGLTFEKVGFQDLILFDDAKIDMITYLGRLITKSTSVTISEEDLLNTISFFKLNPLPSSQITNGHDFVKVLSRFIIKNGSIKQISEETIASLLRSNYRKEYFEKTKLFKDTKEWAANNNCNIY